jgi:hypothetical protein
VATLGGDLRIDVSPIAPSPITGPVPVVRLVDDPSADPDGDPTDPGGP